MSAIRTFALLALIVILFNWKLLLPGQYTWIESPDNLSQVAPWLQMQAQQWHGGHFPLWDPYETAGQPLVGLVQPGTLNPLNWILFSMPFQNGQLPWWAFHWYWAAIQFLGAAFAYMLCRDLKLSCAASLLAGLAYGLGGFVGTIGWPQKMVGGVLLPLVLMFFLRMMRGEKPLGSAATSGALLGATFLTGHHNVPMFFALTMAGLWIYYFVSLGREGWRKAVGPALAFFACAALLAAPQVIPSYEVGKLSLRWSGATHPLEWNEKVEYSVHDQYSLQPGSLLGIFIHRFDQGSAIFVGLVALTLALAGVAARFEQRIVRLLAAIGAGGLLFALGSHSVFHGILYSIVPDLDKARTPNSAVAIFDLGLAPLAAFGLDAFRTAPESRNRWITRVLAMLGLFLFATVMVLLTVRRPQGEEYSTLADTAIAALLLSAVLYLWNRPALSNRTAGVLLILLLLFELNNVTNGNHQPVETAAGVQKLIKDRELADFLTQLRQPVRVEFDDKEIPYNFGDWFGVQAINGFNPSAIKALAWISTNERSLPLLAGNYYIGKEPKRPDQQALFEGSRGLKIFSNPGALPYVRLVYRAVSFPTEDQVLAADQDPKSDLASTVILEGETPLLNGCRETGSAEVTRYRTSSVVLRTSTMCRGMVILADAWFPGWKATVDGKPAKIWKAYGGLRGVIVDGGQHEVKMVYRPASVFGGAALGALGILLCLVLRYAPGRRWRGIHLRPHHPPPTPHHP